MDNTAHIKMHPFPFAESLDIGGRPVGPGAPVLFIAEAGVAHFGDVAMAHQLVDLAASSGADVFKTQVFDVDQLFTKDMSEWRERLRPRNLSLDECWELKRACDDKGLLFMATAHDESRIPWLAELGVPAIKVGSGERNNPEFLKKLAALGKPMIISTGMYDDTDVLEALDALADVACRQAVLLHCVTSYPTPEAQANLASMDRLKEMFPGPVGYSDHTAGDMAILASVARGAQVVEKHITILRDVPNAQDWKVSAGPEDLAQLVANIRRVESMIGHGRKEPAPCEEAGVEWALKSLVAARDLPAGHRLAVGDIVARRPGTGIPANRMAEFYDRGLKRDVAADAFFTVEDLD